MKVYHGRPPGKIPLGYRRENPLLAPTGKNPSNVHDYNTVVSACYHQEALSWNVSWNSTLQNQEMRQETKNKSQT